MAAYVSSYKDVFLKLSIGKQVTIGIVAVCAADRITRALLRRARKQRLRQKREEYREWCHSTVTAVEDNLKGNTHIAELKDEITKLTAEEIVTRIKNGHLTSIDVLRCFQAKALEAHAATNCISHFYPEAEEMANAVDANQEKTGLLCGLPISLKDHFAVKGYPSACGVTPLLYTVYEEDCAIVKVLKEEGAIPFVRTNVPQLMFSIESHNPIFGTVTNPFDSTRGPGGSSSGEGALVGYGASVMGWGSDIGGSVRIPASFCGCFGFKPTVERMSKREMPRMNHGQTIVDYTLGPITQDLDSLVLAMKVIWNGKLSNIDRKMIPILYQEQIVEDTRPLRIGYYIDNGTITPVPAVRRAVLRAKEALEQRGHTVVQWRPPFVNETMLSDVQILQGDGGENMVKYMGEDDVSYSIKAAVGSQQQPMWKRRLDIILASLFGNKQVYAIVKTRVGVGSVCKWFEAVENMLDLRDKVDDDWRKHNLDVVLAPSWFSPAMLLKNTGNMTTEVLSLAGISNTMLYNALNMPAGVMPITKVRKEDVQNMAQYPKKDAFHEAVIEGMKTAEGLPRDTRTSIFCVQ